MGSPLNSTIDYRWEVGIQMRKKKAMHEYIFLLNFWEIKKWFWSLGEVWRGW